jgi:hypothetical protein
MSYASVNGIHRNRLGDIRSYRARPRGNDWTTPLPTRRGGRDCNPRARDAESCAVTQTAFSATAFGRMSNLFKVADSVGEHRASAIFLHGLGGDAYGTWGGSDAQSF